MRSRSRLAPHLRAMIVGIPVFNPNPVIRRFDTASNAVPSPQTSTANFPPPHLTVPQLATVVGIGVPAIRRAILDKRLMPDVTAIAGKGVVFLFNPSRIHEIRTLLS